MRVTVRSRAHLRVVSDARASDHVQLGLNGGGDFDVTLEAVDIDFGSHTEFGQVDTRFDGKAEAWQNLALIEGFDAVEMCGLTMHGARAEAVTGAVQEKFFVTSIDQDLAHNAIHLEALYGLTIIEP